MSREGTVPSAQRWGHLSELRGWFGASRRRQERWRGVEVGEEKGRPCCCPQLRNGRVGGGQSLALLITGWGSGLVPKGEESCMDTRKHVLTGSGGSVLEWESAELEEILDYSQAVAREGPGQPGPQSRRLHLRPPKVASRHRSVMVWFVVLKTWSVCCQLPGC